MNFYEKNISLSHFIFVVKGFDEFKLLTGPLGSSFGHSVTSLGDSNIDQFADFCVGAPHIKEWS